MVQKLGFYWLLKVPGYTIRFHLKKKVISICWLVMLMKVDELIIVCIIWLLVLELCLCNLSYHFPRIRLLSI